MNTTKEMLTKAENAIKVSEGEGNGQCREVHHMAFYGKRRGGD